MTLKTLGILIALMVLVAALTLEDTSCCEPIPTAGRDTLIGRVGDHLFLIGDKNSIKVQEGRELQLRINDCDAGLFDNSGSLAVKISP